MEQFTMTPSNQRQINRIHSYLNDAFEAVGEIQVDDPMGVAAVRELNAAIAAIRQGMDALGLNAVYGSRFTVQRKLETGNRQP